MKSKKYLILSIVFFIATIYNTVQVLKYGMADSSVRFFASYIIQSVAFVCFAFAYCYYKKKEA